MLRAIVLQFRLPVNLLESVFSINRRNISGAANVATDTIGKEMLIKMRKETGYSYARCRTALKKYGEGNFEEAKQWLRNMAVKEGWEKAAKLSSRVTSQGLFGVISQGNVGAAVEIRCETDFVARSNEFKHLVEQITLALLNHGKSLLMEMENVNGEEFRTVTTDPRSLPTAKNRTVEEAVAQTIGKLGENIMVAKSMLYFSNSAVTIIGHAHPIEQFNGVKMGRLISFVGIRRDRPEMSTFPTEKLASQICQHIIGMLPKELGKPLSADEKTAALALEQQRKAKEEATKLQKEDSHSDDDELNAFASDKSFVVDENEKSLLRQSFMLNPAQSVHDYLEGHGAQVTDFRRLELGFDDN